jgi:hypothetical protein
MLSEGGDNGRKGDRRNNAARRTIAGRIDKAAAFFSQAHVVQAIERGAHKTLEWLKANTHRFDGDQLKRPEPWWPSISKAEVNNNARARSEVPTLSPTKDLILLDARRRMMEYRCFENGVRKLYHELVESEIDYPEDVDTLKDAVDFRSIAVHHQLVAFYRTTHPPLNLADMVRRFDYNNLRDGLLAEMVELGFWHARVGKHDHEGFGISLGPVGWAFHEHAFFPAVQHFNQDKYLGKETS